MLPQLQLQANQLVGAIFAGGESRRMGEPKEGRLLWDGRPMLAHGIDTLAAACGPTAPMAIVGHCRGYNLENDSRLVHLRDRQPGQGPLAALDALLASGLAEAYLVMSCDQPLLKPGLLQQLVERWKASGEGPVFFKTDDSEEMDPFPGVYPARLLPLVQQALNAGEFSIRKVLRQTHIQWVPISEQNKVFLSNCNTPESIDALAKWRSVQEVS